ncbi:g1420 [Coccomyxa elongata]
MANKALSTLKGWLSKVPIKAPWKMIGVASSPEFQDYLPPATEYRIRAPASQPVRPSVPAALPERVYDIRYWVRDKRREGQLVGGTNKKHMVTYEVDVTEKTQLSDSEPPPAIGAPYKWKKKSSLLDYDNNGYT